MSLEVLPVNEHSKSTSNFQSIHHVTQNIYLDSTNASISSHIRCQLKLGDSKHPEIRAHPGSQAVHSMSEHST